VDACPHESKRRGQAGDANRCGGCNDGALVCQRELIFGRNAMLHFPVESYKDVKTVFDEIHRRDTHTLALRRQTPSNPARGGK